MKSLGGICIGIYPGQYFDSETGLHYNWHRYYDPTIGRYLRPDPSHSFQPQGGPVPFLLPLVLNTPQELNVFAYVRGNPLNTVDPMGLGDMMDSYRGLHGGWKPPSNDECGCKTSFSICYKRCTEYLWTPMSPDIPSVVLETGVKIICVYTCSVTPCAWDNPVFDDPLFWQ